jgi:hypothetical protein
MLDGERPDPPPDREQKKAPNVGTKALARIQPETARRSRVHNRDRDRGGEPIRLALAVGVIPVPPVGPGYSLPKRSGYGISMEKDYLTLKSAPASRPSGEWKDDDYDVLADGEIVGRIFNAGVSVARPWMWTLDIGHHEHRSPTHGYAATREAAIAAFAKSWRRE